MSKPIEPKEPHLRPVPQAQISSAGPAVTKVTRVTPPHQVRGNSASYNAMLAEAYEGDAKEAHAAIAHDLRVGDKKDTLDVAGEEAVENKPSRRRATAGQPAEEAADRDMSKRIEAGKHEAPSVKLAHDELMLLSSQLRPIETATHISLTAFINLVGILAQPLWQRRTDGLEALARNQMAFRGGEPSLTR